MKYSGWRVRAMRRALAFGIGAISVSLVACKSSPLFKPQNVSVGEEAGSVHLAVLSVAPWELRKKDLQPTFHLSEAEAVQKAANASMAFDEEFLRTFALSLGLGLPTSVHSESTTTARSEGKSTTESTSTASKKSGEAPTPLSTTVPTQVPGVLTQEARNTLTLNPMLEYWLATALYQEVKLLNAYVNDALTVPNTDAYVVRVQVSLMPTRRNLAYDTYCNISFFDGPFPEDQATPTRRKVRVVPLLVTDKLEYALEARSAQQARRFALALSAALQGVGVKADASHSSDEIHKVLGNELNSTFTVGRLSENTVRCRFGAVYSPESHFAMVPQTHNVTLLILADREDSTSASIRQFHAVSLTTFVDSVSGEELASRDQAAVFAQAQEVLRKVGIANPDDELARECLQAVAADRPDELARLLVRNGSKVNCSYTFALLTDVRRRNPLASVEFFAPASNSVGQH